MTVIFRPMLWGQWWRTEPLPAKRPVIIIVVLLVAMLGYGAYQLLEGDKLRGGGLIVSAAYTVAILLSYALAVVICASVRWTLRKWGVLDSARKFATWTGRMVRALFWVGLAGLAVAILLHVARSG